MTVNGLLGNIATFILNPIILLGFVIATIYLFYGIVQLIWKSDGSDLEKNKQNVIWGIIGLFVMFSVFGILRFVLGALGITTPGFFGN